MSQANGGGGRLLTDLWHRVARRLAREAAARLPKPDGVVIENREEPITDWRLAKAGSIISVHRNPLIGPDAKIFAMGSCFAVEIRKALNDLGFDVLPKYYDIEFDRTVMKLSGLPARDSINHYDTFTIRQEFERAFAPQEPGRRTTGTSIAKYFPTALRRSTRILRANWSSAVILRRLSRRRVSWMPVCTPESWKLTST